MRPGRILAGLVLVALGVLFLVDQLSDAVDAGPVIGDWWPSILVAIGVLQFVHSPRSYFASSVLVLLGLLLLAGNLGVTEGVDLGAAWPVLLIVLGLRLLYRGAASRAAAVGIRGGPESATMDALVLFSERDLSAGQGFRGGWVTALFGGATVDLREAELAEEGARLTVSAVLGGVDVLVPESWQVRLSAFPILGGVRDGTRAGAKPGAEEGPRPRLYVDATAFLGRVEVKHGH